MLSRITVAICESMAGVGGKKRLLSGGTGFLAISGITFVFLVFNIWRDYWMSHFSLVQLVLSGIEGEIFSCHQDNLWIGRLNDRNLGFRGEIRQVWFLIWKIYFLGGFQFSCALLLEIEDWILNCWVDFRDSEFDEFIKILRCINPAMCLVMHSAGGILVWLSCIMSRGDICCTQEHDGDDPFYIREFHILMRHYVY